MTLPAEVIWDCQNEAELVERVHGWFHPDGCFCDSWECVNHWALIPVRRAIGIVR